VIVQTFAVGPLACNCTILADETTREAIVVDGGDGVDEVVARLDLNGWRAKYLVHTHAHLDHIGDLGRLRDLTGASGLLHPGDLPLYAALPLQARWIGIAHPPPVVAVDGELHDGDALELAALRCRVLHTPGHTPGSVCFEVSDGTTLRLFTGDTLFAGAIGRWDLGGTSMEDIVRSIRTKLLPFDDATPVVPGHGAFTTIGAERNSNPYLVHG
jgi:glyoxylase-like metal-dependent hydrolase (beta-lactamase superfamily II)